MTQQDSPEIQAKIDAFNACEAEFRRELETLKTAIEGAETGDLAFMDDVEMVMDNMVTTLAMAVETLEPVHTKARRLRDAVVGARRTQAGR
jgi:hypothetical protein